MVMAVVVMMVLTSLTTAVLARTLGSMNTLRHSQDYEAALTAADAGLAHALFTLDQSPPPGAAFTGSGPSGLGTFKYKATRVNDSHYLVKSLGTWGRAKHAIQARVKRTAEFPWALFSDQTLTFNGNGFF